jgi:glycosyltransferase involved in cell wall biosynthesis
MMRPLVTIGLTCFNAADSVERALNSALAQTWRPIEIVAVDDCSTDATREILHRLAEKHIELRVFSNTQNGGVAISRNHIIKEARGEFVVFFDDDDESLPERITKQYERITNYEKEFADGASVICHTARKVIYPDGKEKIEQTMGQSVGKLAPHGNAVAQRILLGKPLEDGYGACPTCSQMARLTTYVSLSGFDPVFRRSEDTDYNIRLALSGGHFVGIEQPLVIQTMTQTSDKSLEDEYRYLLLMMNKYQLFMNEAGQYEYCLQWVDAKQTLLKGQYFKLVKKLIWLFLTHPFLTCRRLVLALPSLGLNRAYSRFHIR